MRNFSLKGTVIKNKGHELDGMADKILNPENRFYLTGKDKEIQRFLKKYHITDNTRFSILEDVIPEGENIILIDTSFERKDFENTAVKMSDYGFTLNENLFQGEVFGMIWDVYQNDKICLDRVEIFATSYCTLNCEKCINYMPFFKKRTHIDLQVLKDDADILFRKVDYVHKLKILGGEILLYPYLTEYIDYIYEKYADKIGSIRLGTNGTIFPGQDALDMCRRDKVILDISDYSIAVPELCKIDEVKELCRKNGVAVEIKRTGEQWLDLGFPDSIPDKKNEEELQEHFFRCAMFCRQFSKGKLWFCCTNFAAVEAGLFPESENDYFDFTGDFSKKELLEWEMGYSRLGHTTFCNVCKGCSEEVNSCKIEVAKQAK